MKRRFLSLSLSGTLTSFPDEPATSLTVVNTTGADVTLAYAGAESETMVIPNNCAYTCNSLTNANQVKASGSGTLRAEAE